MAISTVLSQKTATVVHLLMATSGKITHHVKKLKSLQTHGHQIQPKHLCDMVELHIHTMDVQLTNVQQLNDAIMSFWEAIIQLSLPIQILP